MAGFKVFVDLETLYAAEVNGYLMSQAVMRFTDEAERDANLVTPLAGMVCHIAGLGLQTYEGGDWIPIATGELILTKEDVGLGNVDNTSDAGKPVSTAQAAAIALKANAASPAFTGTPTGLTKTHVGLGSVDNTTDAGKPVSTAQAAAIALKADAASPAFTGTPTGITKTHVGLGNVDNTTDVGKPVSTAQAAADGLRVLKAGDTMTGLLALAAGLAGVGGLTVGGDTNLYRSAADTLRTDDGLVVGGIIQAAQGTIVFGAAGDTNLFRLSAGVLKSNGSLTLTGVLTSASAEINGAANLYGAAVANTALGSKVTGDASTRFKFQVDGAIKWGDGTAAHDVTLYRHAPGLLRTDTVFRAGVYTTAGRPTAAAAGAGGQVYDTTLSKPIWSDGTVWRDAAGTAV